MSKIRDFFLYKTLTILGHNLAFIYGDGNEVPLLQEKPPSTQSKYLVITCSDHCCYR